MYIIILTYSTNHYSEPITKVFKYENLEQARKQLVTLKDRFTLAGCRIFELTLNKIEQINDSEQI